MLRFFCYLKHKKRATPKAATYGFFSFLKKPEGAFAPPGLLSFSYTWNRSAVTPSVSYFSSPPSAACDVCGLFFLLCFIAMAMDTPQPPQRPTAAMRSMIIAPVLILVYLLVGNFIKIPVTVLTSHSGQKISDNNDEQDGSPAKDRNIGAGIFAIAMVKVIFGVQE